MEISKGESIRYRIRELDIRLGLLTFLIQDRPQIT
jgi:hypothetical protein